MNFIVFKNQDEFIAHYAKSAPKYKTRNEVLLNLEKKHKGQSFTVNGFSIAANESVEFMVNWEFANGTHINWRERLVCPKTHLNNRIRLSYHVMTEYLGIGLKDRIYMTERLTPFYRFLKSKKFKVIGSEFIDSKLKSGKKIFKNFKFIRHEDLTELSFNENCKDLVMSFDCLEHIPDYLAALREMFRVLKPGGKLLMSFPFDANSEKHLVRAVINQAGDIEHLTEPEYHGDPVNDQGCLSFYNFGWEILTVLSEVGFKDSHIVSAWSDKFGYLGEEQMLFVATKPH